jgi:large subunit ribosomal protein L17
MRHRNKGRILDRKKAPREAMLKNLASSVLLYEHVTTTFAKGKEVRSLVEKSITLGRRGTLAARRELLRTLPVKSAVTKVIEDLGPRYKDRQGGYTRTTRLPRRQGDAAVMIRIDLV